MDIDLVIDEIAMKTRTRHLMTPQSKGIILRAIERWLTDQELDETADKLRKHPDFSR